MRLTINEIQALKTQNIPIPMITAYDYTTAQIVESSGIPIILVGDSLGQVVLGYNTTVPVTIEQIIHHATAVVRGTKTTHIVADMPFMSFQSDLKSAVANAGQILKQSGAQSVKIEGGSHMATTIKTLVEIGIPVMGHIGLTPQSFNQLGGYKIQGKSLVEAQQLIEDAISVQESGAYAVVLELIPSEIAKVITNKLNIPTIGIGSGEYCDGQVQVINDVLGMDANFQPRHSKQYADLSSIIGEAIKNYVNDVHDGKFPTKAESFTLPKDVYDDLINSI
ncbi:MAG: 3-methyl-2-oxobutanoate hydroxymethyltransferase [Chloroflexi bacterium]|nr:3-methyl-2-oxobutanoate hydroxymethyltransferase [Chloroflexota bacterium]